MFLLLQLAAYGQDTKYKVIVTSQPEGTLQASCRGSNDYYSRWEYAPGEQVSMSGSLKQEYSFVSWTDESGQVLCDSLRYTFTMPNHDVTLVAHTEYDPENPPGPREDGYTDTWFRLYLRSNPSYGGGFQWGLGDHSSQNWLVYEGYVFTVTAYPNTNYKFVRFEVDGETVSTENPYTFTMPGHDMTLYAVYEYDPETPANPNANVWNKESGELIISDFTPGGLYQKVWDVTKYDPWHADVDKVKSGTVAGKSTDEQALDTRLDCEAFSLCKNIEYIDFSRTSGITKISDGCFYDYDNDIKLTTVVLPASTATIGRYAFYKCNALTSVTCFATTPPSFLGLMPGDEGYSGYGNGNGEGGGYGYDNYYDKWAFDGLNKDNIIVHVPAESVPLYQTARGWKEFMILPITQQVSRVTVNLPQAQTYKDMFLELMNTKTLQSQRYVITGATSYTFNNVIHGTSHNIYIKNARGDIMGRIENIDMVDHDIQVSFADLKAPCDVALQLTTHDGTDVTSHATVTWTDRQGNFLQTGSTLSGQMEGAQVRYRVKLDETLGREYLAPTDSLYTVGPSSIINCQLSTIPQLTIGGTVTSESTGSPIRSANVAVSQLLNGLYTVTQTATTDVNGRWTLTVRQAKSDITVSHTDYVKQTLTVDSLTTEIPAFSLRDLTGNVIHLDLYYHASVAEGEESTSDDSFSGAENISYSVYDMTHQRKITDLQLQYPKLILVSQEFEPGTELQVTATSMNDLFMPTTATCTIDSAGQAIAIIGLTEMGHLKAKFEMTDNLSVMGLLFNGNGNLVGWSTYSNTELYVSALPDGQYTLVSMGYNSLFTSVSSLDALAEMGIDQDNMVSTEVNIRSGRITEVNIPFVPAFDETRFLLTGDGTSLTANKQEVSVGQYVTLRATVNFKSSVADATDIQLLFDLPEGCEYVEQSMMVGNQTAYCQQDGRRLSVSVTNLSDAVRFCVVPTQSGLMDPVGYVSFTTGGRQVTQPIGSATITAEDLTITVPSTTARRSLPVTGMATPLSLVHVYDGDVLIGETTSLGTGYWKLMCPLNKPYNLSEHAIYAIITTPEEMQMQSETKTVKINRAGLTPIVSCRLQSDNFEHKHFDFKWDFRTNEATPSYAALTTSAFNDCQQTFEVNFYDENDMVANDTTVIHDVTLYVKTTRGDIRTYPLNYSERHKSWWIHLDWHDRLPVNVDLDYTTTSGIAFDRKEMDDRMTELVDFFEEGRQHMRDVYHMFDDDGEPSAYQLLFDELDALLKLDSLDHESTCHITKLLDQIVGDSLMNEASRKYHYDRTEMNQLLAKDKLTQEELDRLDELVNAHADWLETLPKETVNADSLTVILNNLQASLNTIFEEVRDSMLLSSALFYGPDTTSVKLPDGNASLVIQAPNGNYQRVDISILTAIDEEQLMVNGYEVIPTIDGTPFYYLQTSNGYRLIDAKAMKMYSLTLISEAEAQGLRRAEKDSWIAALANISISMFFPGDCNSKFGDLVQHCVKAADQLKTTSNFLEDLTTNVIPIMADIEGILACLYNNGVNQFDMFIKNIFNKAKAKAEEALKTAKQEVDEAMKPIAGWNEKIKGYEESIEALKRENALQKSNMMDLTPGSPEWIKCDNKIKANGFRIKGHNAAINDINNAIKGHMNGPVKKATHLVEKAEKGLIKCLNKQQWILNIIEHFPIKLVPDKNIFNTIPKPWFAMPLAGTLLKCFPMICVVCDNTTDCGLWVELDRAIKSVMPCEGDAEKAAQLLADHKKKMPWHICLNIGHMAIDFSSLFIESTATFSPLWFLAKGLDIASCVLAVFHPEASQRDRADLERRLFELDCVPKKDEDDKDGSKPSSGTLNNSSSDDNSSNSSSSSSRRNFRFKNVGYIFDPAGYVYEAVNSNRVEGVTASCYYKEMREDAYGDMHEDVVLWDAAQYAQENPLFTDADGQYRWDVPPGLWQVKYEKEGYETTYSDWLPVPPPQLEVNVGITQMRQPNVQKVKAYTDGIDITFDKYMDPQTLTTDNILVTANGQQITGVIQLLNAEAGYQKPDVTYASKVRLNVNSNLSVNDKVQLTVRRAVESYAGVPMEADFTQQFDVEQRITALTTDSMVNMAEDSELTLLLHALPATAAQGRKVNVNSSDSGVVTTDAAELTLDQNGEAHLTVRSQAQGSSIIRFTLADDEEVTTTTLINVRDSASMTVSAPRSSRLNGITLYQGSEIQLTCATAGATILYTLNGACPCNVGSKSVYIYDAPIIITGDSIVIKAMAVANGMEDSPIVEFRYKGIPRPTDMEVVSRQAKEQSTPVAYYRLDGRRTEKPQRGLNIMRRRDGSVSKVVVK